MPDNNTAAPSWLDNVENWTSDQLDKERAQIPKWDIVGQAKHDITVGIAKGAYGFGKGLVTGVIDMAKFGWDVITDEKTRAKTWETVSALAKDANKLQYGSWQEKQEVAGKAADFGRRVYGSIKQEVTKEWDEAGKTDGKRTELLSKWASRSVFEVGSLFVGAGEVNAAVKGAEATSDLSKLARAAELVDNTGRAAKAADRLAETGRVVDAAVTKCPVVEKAAEADKAAEAVADAEKANEAGKAAKIGEWPTPEAQKRLDELERLSKDPQNKNAPHLKRLESELLGNEAAKTSLRRQLGREIPDSEFKTFSGANTVNVMYVEPGGKVYVLEAKGGTSHLGTRTIKSGPAKGRIVKQGTVEYLRDVARSMVKAGGDKRVAGRQILDALEEIPPNLEYIGVRGGYDKVSPATKIVQPTQLFKVP